MKRRERKREREIVCVCERERERERETYTERPVKVRKTVLRTFVSVGIFFRL